MAKKKAPGRAYRPQGKRIKGNAPKAMARVRRILARTTASRAALDERAAGAEASNDDALPVMVFTGPRRRPSERIGPADGYDEGPSADPPSRAPIAPALPLSREELMGRRGRPPGPARKDSPPVIAPPVRLPRMSSVAERIAADSFDVRQRRQRRVKTATAAPSEGPTAGAA